MRIDRVHRLLDALPELPVRSTHFHALIVLAAHRAGLDPLTWLGKRVSALAEADLLDDDGKSFETLFFRLTGAQPFPDARQTLTRLAARLPRERFDDVLSAAASAPPPPPPTPLRDALGARRVLTLYDPRRVRASLKDDERKLWFERLARSGHEREIPRVQWGQLQAVERLREDAPNPHYNIGLERYFSEHAEERKRRHHALVDARAARAGYLHAVRELAAKEGR